jgi:D-alanyl-D-alanine carboxypeptidase
MPDLGKSSETELQRISAFQNIYLEAKAAYVFDVLKSRPLFEFNADAQLPIASLAKIMTALVAEENLPDYLLLSVSKEAVLQEGDEGFIADEIWKVPDLRDAMLISSSNDAAAALALGLTENFGRDFVTLMNKKAGELNLYQTYFLNPTGLDISKHIAGGYVSAKDAAKLLIYVVKKRPSLMEITRYDSAAINSREFKNTNQIISDLPFFIAGKTGFTDLAGGNLAVMADIGYGRPVIIVVLGSTADGRFRDIKTLYEAAVSDTMNRLTMSVGSIDSDVIN